ncbi:MAG: glycosyltransferase family 2 protein [Actinobacteria bacterium]|nr:glycosyltransferase family 2 protein [Actinomycetota bacterium]
MSSSVIVVSHRAHDWLRRSLASVQEESDEVVVVDNGSAGAVVSEVARRAGARTVRLTQNLGFPGGVNAGLAAARGEIVALLNDDAMAESGWITSALQDLADTTVAAVTPKLVFHFPYAVVRFDDASRQVGPDPRPLGRAIRSISLGGKELLGHAIGPGLHRLEEGTLDGEAGPWRWTTGPDPFYVPLGPDDRPEALLVDGQPAPVEATTRVINSAGTYLSAHGFGGDYGFGNPDDGTFDTPAERFGGCGAALVLRAETARRIGGFAADFFAYYEDLDWCWRAQLAGLRVRYQPAGVVRHVGGSTSGGPLDSRVQRLAARNRILCLARNGPLAQLGPETRRAVDDGRADGIVGQLVRSLPRALAQRVRLARAWQRRPEEVWAQWAGVNERWPASAPS